MKTIKSICAFTLLLLLPITSKAQTQVKPIMNLTEYTVKFGEGAKFTEGVKKWIKCYKDNNGNEKWNVWHRVQGEGNVYTITGRMTNWAEMDKEDPAGKACRTVGQEFITPYIESSQYNISRFMPELSRKADFGEMGVVWVTNFTVNDDLTFNEIVKEVMSTLSSKEGDNRGYWYRMMGGEGRDYFVSTPYKDWAALDVDNDGVWEVYESVHGKKITSETRTKFRATLDDVWSYIYTFEKDLSNQ